MMSSLMHSLLLLYPLAHAQETVDTGEPAPVDDYAALRELRTCQPILPPLAGESTTPPPLCDAIPAQTRCVYPRRINGTQKRPGQILDPEDTDPPPQPPYTLMYTPGMQHVFSWLKALSTCRFQAGSSVPRPEEPIKDEFQTMDSFEAELEAYDQQMEQRVEQVVALQAFTEPLLDDVSFIAVLPIDTLGEYNAETGCFFPGPQARVNLEPFTSRDTLYQTTGQAVETHRLIPRRDPVSILIGEAGLSPSATLQSVFFDEDTPEDDLVIQAHPMCVDAETGNQLRNQRNRNQIEDFGIHFEGVFRFRIHEGAPQWLVTGEFVNRTQPEMINLTEDPDEDPVMQRAERRIQVQSDIAVPAQPDATSSRSASDATENAQGCAGCTAGQRALPSPAIVGVFAGLLLLRRRQ